MTSIVTEFAQQSVLRMEENTEKIKKCLSELSDEEIWQRPNTSSNSVGNIILHLCGNITQYILSSLGGAEDNRERDKEFSTQGGLNKEQLFSKLSETVAHAIAVIRGIEQQDVLRKRSVQGFDLSAIGIILHVVEHYSYHTGQIIYWTKLLKGKDMALYADVDLNKKNIV